MIDVRLCFTQTLVFARTLSISISLSLSQLHIIISLEIVFMQHNTKLNAFQD